MNRHSWAKRRNDEQENGWSIYPCTQFDCSAQLGLRYEGATKIERFRSKPGADWFRKRPPCPSKVPTLEATCKQCNHPYRMDKVRDGFCSEYCKREYESQLDGR